MDDQQQYPRFKSAVHPVDTRGIAEVCDEMGKKLDSGEITLRGPSGPGTSESVLNEYAQGLKRMGY